MKKIQKNAPKRVFSKKTQDTKHHHQQDTTTKQPPPLQNETRCPIHYYHFYDTGQSDYHTIQFFFKYLPVEKQKWQYSLVVGSRLNVWVDIIIWSSVCRSSMMMMMMTSKKESYIYIPKL